jgi:hypothetical protein
MLWITDFPEGGWSPVQAAGLIADHSDLSRPDAYAALQSGPPVAVPLMNDDPEGIAAAQAALEQFGFTTGVFDEGDVPVSPDNGDEVPPHPGFSDADEVGEVGFSEQGARTAIAFMAFGDGAAATALAYLATMHAIDPDGPYEDAVAMLLSTFPPGRQQVDIARMVVASDLARRHDVDEG